jgi:hypothetical protein
MASKVTNEDILRINELYYKHKVYAEVARQTGFSAGTVKKYVIPGWKPVVAEDIKRFDINDLPKLDVSIFRGINNYGNLCVLTENEQEEIKELWRELAV